ncbi:MAG: DUF4286 family protein [Dehalococcoidales bacterium]|nr:DUF4286 family protein [Dehalococcoidales bacterium]
MDKKPVMLSAAVECPPALEDKFNKWLDEKHMPMLFKYRGMTKASRMRLVNDKESPRYLTIFEFASHADLEDYLKSPERAAAAADKEETWKSQKYELKWLLEYQVLKTWQR